MLSTEFQWTQTSKKDLVERWYIFANDTMWLSVRLFRRFMVILGPLLITELLLVWAVGHKDPQITDCATKRASQVPWTGKLLTWMWRLSLQSHS